MPPYTLTVGYKRAPDGSAQPVCEPTVDIVLLELWKYAHAVTLDTDAFLVTGTSDNATVRFEGSMRPHDLARAIEALASETLVAMRMLISIIETRYPFESGAKHIVGRTNRVQLICALDTSFIETETPVVLEGESVVRVPLPKIVSGKNPLRVIVTGNPEGQFLRAWADQIICDRMRETVLELLASESDETFA